jgi:hypothetical protein
VLAGSIIRSKIVVFILVAMRTWNLTWIGTDWRFRDEYCVRHEAYTARYPTRQSWLYWRLAIVYDLRLSQRYEDGRLLGCSAVYTGVSLPTFQRSVLPPSSFPSAFRCDIELPVALNDRSLWMHVFFFVVCLTTPSLAYTV